MAGENKVNPGLIPAETPAPNCFIDRELSWLQFNLRVLREAGDPSVPLLERLKFRNLQAYMMGGQALRMCTDLAPLS